MFDLWLDQVGVAPRAGNGAGEVDFTQGLRCS